MFENVSVNVCVILPEVSTEISTLVCLFSCKRAAYTCLNLFTLAFIFSTMETDFSFKFI